MNALSHRMEAKPRSLTERYSATKFREMTEMIIHCAYCGASKDKPKGQVNRARRAGLPVYCDRECAGLAHRKWKSPDQRKSEKQAYDARRRVELADRIKAEKHTYFKRTYDPVRAAAERRERMPYHVEYCRRPEYREWKREYDRQYRAGKEYGDFAECFLLVMDIRAECLAQQTDYEIRYAKGGVAKSQQRKRAYERSISQKPKRGSLGNLELGQGWQNGGLASGLRRLPSQGNSSHNQHATPGGSAVEALGGGGRDNLRGDIGAAVLRGNARGT